MKRGVRVLRRLMWAAWAVALAAAAAAAFCSAKVAAQDSDYHSCTYRGQSHEDAWTYYTTDTRHIGRRGELGVSHRTGAEVSICGHHGQAGAGGQYCVEGVEHEWAQHSCYVKLEPEPEPEDDEPDNEPEPDDDPAEPLDEPEPVSALPWGKWWDMLRGEQ